MKLISLFFMIFFATHAYADLTLVAVGSDGNAMYFDSKTIKRSGHLISVWVIDNGDFSDKNIKFKSHKTLYTIDCKESKIKEIQSLMYSGSNANGKIISSSFEESKFLFIPPGSIIDLLKKRVC